MWFRWLIVAWLLVPALAFARPKIALAPLDGDDDGSVTAVVAEEVSQKATIVDPKPTQAALQELGYSDVKGKKAQKALRKKLKVDVIIFGQVSAKGSGKKASHKLVLDVAQRNKEPIEIEFAFKTATSNKFREQLREELGKSFAGAEGEASEDDDVKDKDRDKDKIIAAPPPRRFRHSDDGGEPGERHPVTESAVWLDIGAAALHRSLTYQTTGAASPPPPVGTASASGELEAEIYPAAFDSLDSTTASIGFAASVAKTVGLSIAVPGTTGSAKIDEARYTVGARYRFHFGQTTLAVGLSYWRQRFIADRSGAGMTLDMPDTDYSAVAPGAVLRVAATPKIGVMLLVDVPLVLASGGITTGTSLGKATVFGGSAEAALDYQLAPHYGLRFAGLYDQLDFLFDAPRRGVSAAVDRTLGLTATFALIY